MGRRRITPTLPSFVFRITRASYAANASVALSGIGGLYDAGRWHEKGQRIVYTSQSSSLALLERLVHADEWIAERHPDRVVLTLAVPMLSCIGYTAAELATRDPNWRVEGNALCRRLGRSWLDTATTCALMVPSAANPLEYNILFNPTHGEFPAFVNANPTLTTTPIDLEDRVVSLATAARRKRKTP